MIWRLGLVPLLMLGACAPAPPVTPVTPPPDIALIQERLFLGRVPSGGWIRGALRVKAGDQGATLTQVAPSCGCTISLTEVPLGVEAGASIDLPLAMDLSRLSDLGAPQDPGPRLIERDVVVASQSGTRLTARVAVEVSDRVLVEPAQVRFATVVPGNVARSELRLKAAAGAPLPELLGVDSEVAGLEATWEATDPSDQGLLIRLAWTPSEAGPLEGQVVLRLSDAADARLPIRVLGVSEAAVTVDPARIENLSAATSRPVVARVTLQRRDGLPLNILGTSCTNHRVQVRVDENAGPTRTLQILVPVLALPQEVEGLVTVRTDAPGAEILTIPVRVRASG